MTPSAPPVDVDLGPRANVVYLALREALNYAERPLEKHLVGRLWHKDHGCVLVVSQVPWTPGDEEEASRFLFVSEEGIREGDPESGVLLPFDDETAQTPATLAAALIAAILIDAPFAFPSCPDCGASTDD